MIGEKNENNFNNSINIIKSNNKKNNPSCYKTIFNQPSPPCKIKSNLSTKILSIENILKNKILSPIKKNISFPINNFNNNSSPANFLINIYNNLNKEETEKSQKVKNLDLENMANNRKSSVNSFTIYRNFNQFKKEEFKNLIDDPLFPNIIFVNDHPTKIIKGFTAKSFVNFK